MRRAMETIEKIAMRNNQDEVNKVLTDIYCIAHVFASHCENPHEDWKELEQKLRKILKDY